MPSHTVPTAFFKLQSAGGYPWSFPQWKKTTGIHHGLFPKDDEDLPHGWTRLQSEQVADFFERLAKMRNEAELMKYVGAARSVLDPDPGRFFFKTWIIDCWKKWKINDKIIAALTNADLHPSQIMLAEAESAREHGHPIQTLFPPADGFVPLAIDAVARALFGDEALSSNGRLPQVLRPYVSIFLQRCWDNIRKQHGTNAKNVEALENLAVSAFEGKSWRSPS